jgi:hypothetical protein
MYNQEPLFDDDSFFIDEDGHDYRTGPKHPGLKAWLDELPDVRNEDLYRIDVHFPERIECFYQVMAHKKAEAIEAFDLMFLGVCGAVYGDGATSIRLFAPEVEGQRKKLADLPIPEI